MSQQLENDHLKARKRLLQQLEDDGLKARKRPSDSSKKVVTAAQEKNCLTTRKKTLQQLKKYRHAAFADVLKS